MKNKKLISTWLLLSLMFLGGCWQALKYSHPSEGEVFINAEPLLGENIVVSGFLKFELENKNIFPIQAKKLGINRALCLPVFIRNGDVGMEMRAKIFSNSLVTVKGKVIDLRRLGLMSFSACRPVGIEVVSIDKM